MFEWLHGSNIYPQAYALILADNIQNKTGDVKCHLAILSKNLKPESAVEVGKLGVAQDAEPKGG